MNNRRGSGGPRVLVVDDHAASRLYILAALRQYGCSVKAAESLAEARAIAADWLPATVLTDWQLGDGTGAEVAQAIRRDRPRTELKPRFLLISGSRADALPAAAHESGFAKILQKPVPPEELARAAGAKTPAGHPSDDITGPVHHLFRRELASELDRLESMIENRQLRAAVSIAHRMTGGSELAGEARLAYVFRELENVLRKKPEPEQAASAWFTARREALDFLFRASPLQGA